MTTTGEINISCFDAVPTQLSSADRQSILTVQGLLAQALGRYAYLEIGSYLGGSLQPHIRDERCVAVYSIDTRPNLSPDERGDPSEYPDNTTQRMIDALTPAYGSKLAKLTCFERDASTVASTDIGVSPQLCFIDGEHTDEAVLRDFVACLRLMARPGIIMFDDSHIVYRGLKRSIEELATRGEPFHAYVLPDKIGVIEIGDLGLYRTGSLMERIASADAYLYATIASDHYREVTMTIRSVPGVRLARRLQNALLRRGAPTG